MKISDNELQALVGSYAHAKTWEFSTLCPIPCPGLPCRTCEIVSHPIKHLCPNVEELETFREKCLDCSAWSWHEVKNCPAKDCALWPYRLGKNPGIKPGSRKGNAEALKKARSQKSIKRTNSE